MGARLYVGNLSYETQADGLRQLVEGAGHAVADVHVVTDRETGRSRGFAFVELKESDNLPGILESLDGQSLDGRRLAVSEARPRQPREGGGGDRRGGPSPQRGPRNYDRGGPPRGPGRPGDRRPDTEHRRPRSDGGTGFRPDSRPGGSSGGYEDRRPRRDPGFGAPPPPGFGGPPSPLETSGKEEGRRRNKKWDKGRTEEKKDDGRRKSGGGDRGRKRRGGGNKGGWDNGDDW